MVGEGASCQGMEGSPLLILRLHPVICTKPAPGQKAMALAAGNDTSPMQKMSWRYTVYKYSTVIWCCTHSWFLQHMFHQSGFHHWIHLTGGIWFLGRMISWWYPMSASISTPSAPRICLFLMVTSRRGGRKLVRTCRARRREGRKSDSGPLEHSCFLRMFGLRQFSQSWIKAKSLFFQRLLCHVMWGMRFSLQTSNGVSVRPPFPHHLPTLHRNSLVGPRVWLHLVA